MLPGTNMQGYQFRIGYAIVKKNLEEVIKKEQTSEPLKANGGKPNTTIKEETQIKPEDLENNFDHSTNIIDDEEEEGTPYKMKD